MASFRQLIEQLLSEYDRVISENLSLKEDLKGMAGIHTPRSSSSSRSPSGIPCESDSPIFATKNELRPSSKLRFVSSNGTARTSCAPSDIPSEPDTPINAREHELATIPYESVCNEVSNVRDPGFLPAPAADDEPNLDVDGLHAFDQHQVVAERASWNIMEIAALGTDSVAKDKSWPIRKGSFTFATEDSEAAAGDIVTKMDQNCTSSKDLPIFRVKVVMEFNRKWIEKVSLLAKVLFWSESSENGDMFRAFVVDVSLKLHPSVHAQSEVFGMPHVLYICMLGLVSRKGRVHRTGAVWGADFMLVDSELLEPYESRALTYTELTTLDRSTFMELLKTHTENCPELRTKVRQFCCWLAFQRAFIVEAKSRLARTAGAFI
mmetsp:Transcript_77509/g.217559  ORF Transcript_77509/g.217559 Transcript_77509/m.217559 type:complete len:378 (-) Transcript_77509:73-1206(-)